MSIPHDARAWTSPALRLTAAGFAATAVAFGPARMGFGLFLPAFREDFALSTSTAGAIASGGFLAVLVALVASVWATPRLGERFCVVVGALSAAVGFAVIAVAGSAAALTLGIALAGVSAGLCWAPFNDAAERVVPDAARATALSVVSTGTSVGVVGAAVTAIAATQGAIDWRGAFAAFSLVSFVLVGIAAAGVPGGSGRRVLAEGTAVRPRLLRRAVAPLYATAFCFGMTNTIFLSFAADRVARTGGLPGLPDDAASGVIFIAYGTFGLAGLATGRIEARYGLTPLFCAIFAMAGISLVLIGLAPSAWVSVVAAAGLHGIAIMMMSAVLSFWSLRLFPGRGTLGFTATLLSMSAGAVIGPVLAGTVSEAFGGRAMFLIAALPAFGTALWFSSKLSQPRPRLPPLRGVQLRRAWRRLQ